MCTNFIIFHQQKINNYNTMITVIEGIFIIRKPESLLIDCGLSRNGLQKFSIHCLLIFV